MPYKLVILFILSTIFLQSCKGKVDEQLKDEIVEERCASDLKDQLHGEISLKDLKNLIKTNPQEIKAFLEQKCFTKADFGKNLYVSDVQKFDSLKIKQVKQGVFFLNKISAMEISQEIVYKLQYSFPIKYLNQYKIAIEKEAKKGNFYRSNSVVTNEDFKITYEIDRWDNRKLKNSYSYQIDTHDGFAKLTIFYSEDLPVD
ncbi:hypothetical protein [Faecalibacter rhinopitheci]|uniref:Lipoprotein n=1 Tax=Faecalibacter rhinopitheci TaxID=2779678 RepID=A0A8J7KIJ6_9FLAO|nr:hypothetical protein [Faecalibacter rhinopitheci]MBF0597891.1 hypothetical protein [Faecalibacter rhinopitheci]MBQ0148708.1 hypothetical protein [Candidatus Onthonaster equi]